MQSIIENIRENFVVLLQLQNRVDLLFICFVILKWMSFFTQLIADLGFSVARPHLPWICTIFVASRYIRAVWSEWHFFYSSSQNIMYWYSLGCIPYIQSIPNRYVKYFGGSFTGCMVHPRRAWFHFFLIMFYYIIITTYQKIGGLFCSLISISGLWHSVRIWLLDPMSRTNVE